MDFCLQTYKMTKLCNHNRFYKDKIKKEKEYKNKIVKNKKQSNINKK